MRIVDLVTTEVTVTLNDWIKEAKLTREQAAGMLGVSKRHLDAICARARMPSVGLVARIESVTLGRVTLRDVLPVPRSTHRAESTRSAAA